VQIARAAIAQCARNLGKETVFALDRFTRSDKRPTLHHFAGRIQPVTLTRTLRRGDGMSVVLRTVAIQE